MVDMKLVSQIHKGEQQCEQSEHAFVPVVHVNHVFDFRRFKRERFSTLRHHLTQLLNWELIIAVQLDDLSESGQKRVQSTAPDTGRL